MFDPRVAFYLKHRQQIEEWAALAKDAAAAIDGWLAELQPEVEALAKSLGPDVTCSAFVGSDQQWPSYRLVSSSWNLGTYDDAPVSVVLGWVRGKTNLHGWNTPYAGVRVPSGNLDGRLRDFQAFKRVRASRRDGQEPELPAWSCIEPGPDFPESTAEYRKRLLSALRSAWEAYAPVIQAVSTTPAA